MTLTDTNLYVLNEAINSSTDGLIREVRAASVSHIRRCITAGALERTAERIGRGYAFRLTESGRALLQSNGY